MPCNDCIYARWDYEEYYGGARRWYMEECMMGRDPEEECESYERDTDTR